MTDVTTLSIEPKKNLPHPPIDERLILAVENAVRQAWGMLHESHKTLLDTAEEDAVSETLQRTLEKLRVTGICESFNCDVFQTIARESKFRNYNASTLDKMPDLIFTLAGQPRPGVAESLYDGIFVECKLIDNKRKDVGRYVANGLTRFLTGDYAWAMPHAMMLAYVRVSRTMPAALTEYLSAKNSGKSNMALFQVQRLPEACTPVTTIPTTYRTVHARTWVYPETVTPPGNIEIRHMWLKT